MFIIGLQPIHPQWIIDSIASEWRVALPIDAYILPSGSSVIHPYFGFRKNVYISSYYFYFIIIILIIILIMIMIML